MAPYITQADLVERFGTAQIMELSDRDNTGSIDAGRVAQAISDTCARIDGYLGARYTLPLTTLPAAIPPLACDLCRYILAERPTDEMRDRYQDAIAWFGKVAEGKFGLGLDQTGQEPPAAPTGVPQFTTAPRYLTRENLYDFVRPPRWP
jgi:phage gp36-like protein